MKTSHVLTYDENFAALSLYVVKEREEARLCVKQSTLGPELGDSIFASKKREKACLSVKQSNLGPEVGDGLFAAKPIFGPGVHLCDYTGTYYNTKDAMAKQNHSYLMRLGSQTYVDALDHLDVLARFINDCRNPALHNVKFVKVPGLCKAKVVTLRPILEGEELYVDYGKWYWAGFPGKPKKLSIQSTCELLQKIEHLLKLRDQTKL